MNSTSLYLRFDNEAKAEEFLELSASKGFSGGVRRNVATVDCDSGLVDQQVENLIDLYSGFTFVAKNPSMILWLKSSIKSAMLSQSSISLLSNHGFSLQVNSSDDE